jgi:hypothetical protein
MLILQQQSMVDRHAWRCAVCLCCTLLQQRWPHWYRSEIQVGDARLLPGAKATAPEARKLTIQTEFFDAAGRCGNLFYGHIT